MKEKNRQVQTQFEPAVQFEVKAAPFRAVETTELERLKSRLLRQLLRDNGNPEQYALLRRAANEAAAFAWLTSYPLLVFPALLEEKARDGLLKGEPKAGARKRGQNTLVEVA